MQGVGRYLELLAALIEPSLLFIFSVSELGILAIDVDGSHGRLYALKQAQL